MHIPAASVRLVEQSQVGRVVVPATVVMPATVVVLSSEVAVMEVGAVVATAEFENHFMLYVNTSKEHTSDHKFTIRIKPNNGHIS